MAGVWGERAGHDIARHVGVTSTHLRWVPYCEGLAQFFNSDAERTSAMPAVEIEYSSGVFSSSFLSNVFPLAFAFATKDFWFCRTVPSISNLR